jgi:hypothetical protein
VDAKFQEILYTEEALGKALNISTFGIENVDGS